MNLMGRLAVVVVLGGCGKSGEHQSLVAICDRTVSQADRLEGRFIDETDRQLRSRLARAGFASCTRHGRRAQQLGARSVASYCGRIGDADVLALIDRPGERDCVLELDLRADVSGDEVAVTEVERPIIAFRDEIGEWFRQRLAPTERPGRSTTVRASGAWLGEHVGSASAGH